MNNLNIFLLIFKLDFAITINFVNLTNSKMIIDEKISNN